MLQELWNGRRVFVDVAMRCPARLKGSRLMSCMNLHELHELIELQQRKKKHSQRPAVQAAATRYVAARSSRFERLKQQQRRPIRDTGPSTECALVERSMMGDMQPSPACRASRRAVVRSATDELSAVTPARGKPR